ncbi:MAG: hypothetical protein Ta2G_07480 [Termitinemataceae bacterium]|nr:MAG: hypothetical protein Ta2G_07480 [Termitinemataceae bacterium]
MKGNGRVLCFLSIFLLVMLILGCEGCKNKEAVEHKDLLIEQEDLNSASASSVNSVNSVNSDYSGDAKTGDSGNAKNDDETSVPLDRNKLIEQTNVKGTEMENKAQEAAEKIKKTTEDNEALNKAKAQAQSAFDALDNM